MTQARTTFQRLLRYPHGAAFDKKPHDELALRVRHASGCTWAVRDEVLTVKPGSSDARDYSLTEYTIASLATELRLDGFEVPYVSSSLRLLSASILVDGSGDQAKSNGDHLTAFTSLLWVILSVYALVLKSAGVAKEEALRQMVIPQAEDYWLDVWGQLYGVERQDSELDPKYAARIPEEAFRIRVNALAIEKAIKDLTGKDVIIREPWKQIFRLDVSQLSGRHHLYDGARFGYHLLQPVAFGPTEWGDILAVIDRNRAGGVLVLPPVIELRSFVDASMNGTVWSGIKSMSGIALGGRQSAPLGVMRLDEDSIVRNYMAGITSLRSNSNQVGVSWRAAGGGWDSRTWAGQSEASTLAGDASLAATQLYASDADAGAEFEVFRAMGPPWTPPVWSGAWDDRTWSGS